ncbi:deoxyribonuclease IV [Dehalobacterium formicoaceticum]|uniref:Probable endonuclease 4 n=1 Tax=Dehalobacterium formicoaceticum TaxID=51515 RepID=A0ABT1Y936_9FIRM|nr:deoxyribonuclease IV [Dehalobacterium formicoaceticum]MCR6547088.1 deoxyribonuclease IV [Dehalobacterium formicoaceticum]
MFLIGCHLSSAKGFEAMGKDALKIGANTFQFFTRNPRGSKGKKVDPMDAKALLALMKEHQFGPILAHAPYTMNPAAAVERTREFAWETMADDLARMEYLPGNLYNFHPGNHVGQGTEAGIRLIIEMLNKILKRSQTTIVLLETMAGKGTEIGRSFEELKEILDGVILKDKMGVCLDTCHISDAGYDIINNLDGVIEEFHQIIGLDKLYAIHLNDSMNDPASRKDRHQKIGQGTLGLKTITAVINHPKLHHLPFFLETPNELSGYTEEIGLLRKAYLK